MPPKNKKQLSTALINKIKKEQESALKFEEQIKEKERVAQEETRKLEEETRLKEQLLKEKSQKKKARSKENKKKRKLDAERERNQAIITRLNMNKTVVKDEIINSDNKPSSGLIVTSQTKHNVDIRSPICCVLGHVDTGKTSLLDKIRGSFVHTREFGGITQQIGVTYIPQNNFSDGKDKLEIPGLLVMDTPGHAAFMNMRIRGSSICDIAILVVDITHGIESQTEECIELLKTHKLPFIVALNKSDLIHGQQALNYKIQEISLAFAEKGFNSYIASVNPDPKRNLSLIPVSAKTGEGISDLLYFVGSLTQKLLREQLTTTDEFKCLIMEIKNVIGLGRVLDVILIDGDLSVNDDVVLHGKNGHIFTKVKNIFVPPPLVEMRTAVNFDMVNTATASRGIRITLKDSFDITPGTYFYKYTNDTKESFSQRICDISEDIKINTSPVGIHVNASTLGSLEALCQFLEESGITISSYSLGDVNKKDFTFASLMIEKDSTQACIVAFDVKIPQDNIQQSDGIMTIYKQYPGIKVFSSQSIFNLRDAFLRYIRETKNTNKESNKDKFIWPCVLEILPQYIFNNKDPLVMGVKVLRGCLYKDTPICAIRETDNLFLGVVTSIQKNRVNVDKALKSDEVAIKIETTPPYPQYGNHFNHTNQLVSQISRESIDFLKEHYTENLKLPERKLIKELKSVLNLD